MTKPVTCSLSNFICCPELKQLNTCFDVSLGPFHQNFNNSFIFFHLISQFYKALEMGNSVNRFIIATYIYGNLFGLIFSFPDN
jgi:hypothetical protein